jgi:hypothetical protein
MRRVAISNVRDAPRFQRNIGAKLKTRASDKTCAAHERGTMSQKWIRGDTTGALRDSIPAKESGDVAIAQAELWRRVRCCDFSELPPGLTAFA